MAVNSSGDLFIANSVNSVVREVTGGTINTIAGDGIPGDTGNNGPATSAELGDPVGLAVQSLTVRLWVADSASDVVREVASATITTVAGDGFENYGGDGGAATAAELNNPTAVAVDSSGDLFIADTLNNVVREVNATTGVITTVAGDGIGGYAGDGGQASDAELLDPTGVAVNSTEDLLFIADSGNNVIRQVNLQTGVITTIAGNYNLGAGYSGDGGPATAAQLNVPTGVAVDSRGNLFIADSGNNVVREVSGGDINTVAGNFANGAGYSGDGGAATSAQLSDPVAVAVDANDDLFIADLGNDVIREVTAGNISTVAGDYVAGPGYSGDGNAATSAQLNQPEGIAVNAAGTDLYVADAGNNVIREVSGGIISTIAGDNTYGYSGDGSQASGAASSNPYGVAVDASGDVFIADTFNNAIREIRTLPNSSALPVAVAPAVLTVTATSFQIPYGSPVPALEYQISGFENGESSSVVSGQPGLSTTATSTSTVGDYSIDVNVSDMSAINYVFMGQIGTISITQATPQISWNPLTEIVYGTKLASAELNATSPVSGQFTYSPSLGTVLDAALSQTLWVTFTPDDTTDYTSASPSVDITVLRADLTVTANDASMTYGGSVPAFTATITGFVNDDNSSVVSGQLKLTTTATSASPVGSYPILIDVSQMIATNYVFGGAAGTLVVNPAVLTVTPNPASMTYGGNLPAFSAGFSGFLNGDTAAVVSGQAGFSTTATTASPVGSYPLDINVSGLSATNYTCTGSAGTLNVTPAPLVITASSASITVGQAIPPLSVTYSGFENGETAAVLTSQPTVATTATAQSAPGVYPVVATGAAAANYSISYVAGTLTINEQKRVEVTGYPPTVEGVSIESVKVGKHSKAKVILLQLSEAVNSAGADNRATYSLVTIPSKKKQKCKAVALSKALYSPTATGSTITLYTKKPLVLSPPLLLTVNASGINDTLGASSTATIRGSRAQLCGDALEERRES